MNTLNRRKFLSSSALLATSSLISVTANAACKDPMPAKWDEEVDVIVVGSGFAGLAAAAEAKNANAGNVIVLEKMRAPGGNSVINGGIFAVPGNPAQVKLGIKDSPELLASDMIAAGLGYGYPEKIKAMTEEAFRPTNGQLKNSVFSTTTKSVTLFLVTSQPSTVPDLKLFTNSLHTPRS